MQQSRIDLDSAYKNMFDRFKKGKKGKSLGFPKFKSKKHSKLSYREPQVGKIIEVKDNKLKLLKLGWVKFKGLDKNFKGIIKSVTVTKLKNNTYSASILVETEKVVKQRISDNIIGIDLGLKEFAICSNGEFIKGIKPVMEKIDLKIRQQQKHLSRKIEVNKKNKIESSKRQEKCRVKLADLHQYRTNVLNHFQWHLSNKLCSENKTISLESLLVSGMIKNRKLSRAIHNINWSSFLIKLEHKAKEYETEIVKIDRWFPSSKTCSSCGKIKKDLTLSDRVFKCECGFEMDRDLNASLNIKKEGIRILEDKSEEYFDYKRGEKVRPVEIIYNLSGLFSEKRLECSLS